MSGSTVQFATLLRVSTTRLDGGCLFGSTPKDRWEGFATADRLNRVAIGNYAMLLDHPEAMVLVDSGPGDKGFLKPDIPGTRSRSSLPRELRELGVSPKDIKLVIATHLREENAGGATHITSSGRTLPTFPNARYVIQRAALEEAMMPNERHMRHYSLDDVRALRDSDQITEIDGPMELLTGLWVFPTPGPTAGHQSVIAQIGARKVAFLGLLFPTLLHLNPQILSASDTFAGTTMATKKLVIDRAEEEDWLVAGIGCDQWTEASELRHLAEQAFLGLTPSRVETKSAVLVG
jgi:glyoxylase-like metal-dependent hydrolase (beta-lactamase superfamily II)